MKVCWSKCFGHSDAGDQGKEGERDDDKGHFLAEQGKEDLLQRSLPQVKNLCVHLVHNLMARCVAWNPKEMMRQVAVVRFPNPLAFGSQAGTLSRWPPPRSWT